MIPMPLFMRPHFEEMPWGGERLLSLYGKDIPSKHTGESFEVSVHPKGNSTVENGPCAGATLSEAIALCGGDLTGASGELPLLIKIIDAKDWLSVQVHPDDAYAGANEHGASGKNEAWVVLHAPSGAQIVHGITCARDDFERALMSGNLNAVLRRKTVRAGDIIDIPAGTVHAIGRGILLYEVQQSSDITYRVYDWDRQPPRELHVRQALDVIRDDPAPEIFQPEQAPRAVCLSHPSYHLERWDAADGLCIETDGARFWAVTALTAGVIRFERGSLPYAAGRSFILPAQAARYYLSGGQLLAATIGGSK